MEHLVKFPKSDSSLQTSLETCPQPQANSPEPSPGNPLNFQHRAPLLWGVWHHGTTLSFPSATTLFSLPQRKESKEVEGQKRPATGNT